MTNEIRGLPAPCTSPAYDHLAEAITRAVGPNDPYPSDAQLGAHRTKQNRNEQFINVVSKEIIQ
jgi:hypothetical protein